MRLAWSKLLSYQQTTLLVASLLHLTLADRSFTIRPDGKGFLKDGQDFHYIAGEMHYQRIPEAFWTDRIEKAKLAGLDAIQIYVPWNIHEPEEDEFDFTGSADIERFLSIINETGLLALVRAGPYICAEWAFGGLPPWLLRKNSTMTLRSSDPAYYQHVEKWMKKLMSKLKKFLYTEGGPIIMVQLENEYGSYPACDDKYMSDLYDLGRQELGNDIIFYTTDGPSVGYLKCGSPDPRYLATIDFGTSYKQPELAFESLVEWRNVTPWVNSELYVGWLDVWGGAHNRVDANSSAKTIDILYNSSRVSMSLYMFHGGTNFGFWSGSPGGPVQITSYDYDAPVSEAGDITPKFKIIQQVIAKAKKIEPAKLPDNEKKADYGTIKMNRVSNMLFKRTHGDRFDNPVHMEQILQYEGFAIYTTLLPAINASQFDLTLERFADYVHIFYVDRKMMNFTFAGLMNNTEVKSIQLAKPDDKFDTLVLMAENTGYVNYGGKMQDNVKGVIGSVKINDQVLTKWKVIPVNDPFSISVFNSNVPVQGSIYLGLLKLCEKTEVFDTFVEMEGFTRGIISINGFNLGRYWQTVGPQQRLYLPRTLLTRGVNVVTIVELSGDDMPPGQQISFHKEMKWGKR